MDGILVLFLKVVALDVLFLILAHFALAALAFAFNCADKLYTGLPGGLAGKESACNAGDLGFLSGWEDPLEKGKATLSSILAWRIPWTV